MVFKILTEGRQENGREEREEKDLMDVKNVMEEKDGVQNCYMPGVDGGSMVGRWWA